VDVDGRNREEAGVIEVRSAADVDAGEILEGLNLAFPHWGDRRTFDWMFSRECDGLLPDLLTIREGGRLVAFSSIVYRGIASSSGAGGRLAIVSASWTASHLRGRGAFTELLARSVAIAEDREAIISAFGTWANPSRGRFGAMGASLLSSVYARSPMDGATVSALDDLEPEPAMFAPRPGTSHFVYSPAEWEAQFLRRPNPVRCLGARGRWAALIESTSEFDRVVALSATDEATRIDAIDALAGSAQASGRRLFVYSLSGSLSEALTTRGYELIPGYFALHPAAGFTDWVIQNGDRT
jgi:hypothetical protein